MKFKAKITFEWEYEADPKYYNTDDPVEMAKMDIQNMEGDAYLFIDDCPNEPKIEIVAVEEKE